MNFFEFHELFKNTIFIAHLLVTASLNIIGGSSNTLSMSVFSTIKYFCKALHLRCGRFDDVACILEGRSRGRGILFHYH